MEIEERNEVELQKFMNAFKGFFQNPTAEGREQLRTAAEAYWKYVKGDDSEEDSTGELGELTVTFLKLMMKK